MVIELEEDECSLLRDVLDWWLEDYEAATTDVVKDQSIESAEQLLEAVDSMHSTFDVATRVREKLNASRASSSV